MFQQLGYNGLWNFSLQGSAAVQELLNKEDLELEELLDEEGLLLELKAQNPKLIEYLVKEETFAKIISNAITEPDMDDFEYDTKKYFKFPFVCADLLSSDSQPIVSEFFNTKKKDDKSIEEPEPNPDDVVNVDDEQMEKENKEDDGKEPPISEIKCQHLDQLFGFLDIEPVNLTSAGYFAKVVNNLLAKRPTALLSYLYEKNTDALLKMVKRIESKSVAEFLAKVLTFESSVMADSNNEAYDTERIKTLKKVFEMLGPDCNIEEINNTAFLICEVFGKYNSMHNSHQILKALLESDSIEYLFKVLQSNNQTSACAVALILGNIFAYYILLDSKNQQQQEESQQTDFDNENNENSPSPNPTQTIELKDDIPLVNCLNNNFEYMAKFIGSAIENSDTQITNQQGIKIAPFGSARLKVLELIIIALKSNNKSIFQKIIQTNFAKTLMELFGKYEWNNMLHNQIEKVFNLIIDGNSDDLKTYLMAEDQANLPDFLMSSVANTEFTMQGTHKRKIRKGYVGHILKISNKLIESKDPIIRKVLDDSDLWLDYVENQLNGMNEVNQPNYGWRDPRQPSAEEEVNDPQLDIPQFMQKFHKFFNKGQGEGDGERDEDDDENKDENDEDNEQNDNDDDDDEDTSEEKHSDNINDILEVSDKHILTFGSGGEKGGNGNISSSGGGFPGKGGRSSFGFVSKIEPKDGEEDVEDEVETELYIVEPPVVIDLQLAPVEENHKDYYENNLWSKQESSWHSADDILAEMEDF